MNSSIKNKDRKTALAGPCWYVVQSKMNQERIAKENLERQEFETYLPMRLCAATSKRPLMPLFPRFLFVSVDPTKQRWRSIFSTYGVHDLLRQGDHPAILANSAIDELKAREIEGVLHLSDKAKTVKPFPFKPGDKVRIKADPFIGLNAVFDRRVDAERVMILLSVLGRDSRVELHISGLEAS